MVASGTVVETLRLGGKAAAPEGISGGSNMRHTPAGACCASGRGPAECSIDVEQGASGAAAGRESGDGSQEEMWDLYNLKALAASSAVSYVPRQTVVFWL